MKEVDVISGLASLKTAELMLEYITGSENKAQELFDDFKKTHPCPVTEEEILEQIEQLIDSYINEIGFNQYKELFNSDYSTYTSEHHGNAYFNEISNSDTIIYFLSAFEKAVCLDKVKEGNFMIMVYDLNDFEIYFETQEDMETFVNNYQCEPYVAMRKTAYDYEEMYSA